MKRLTPIKLRKNIDYFAFFDCGTKVGGIVDAGRGARTEAAGVIALTCRNSRRQGNTAMAKKPKKKKKTKS
jgi:hypothetical protein